MRQHVLITGSTLLLLIACGGGGKTPETTAGAEQPEVAAHAAGGEAPTAQAQDKEQTKSNEFVVKMRDTPQGTAPSTTSKLKPTRTEAALKFTVIDKDKGPIPGIIVALTGAAGKKFYTAETDAEGYAEVLVPAGQKYDLAYLSLGRRDIGAQVTVASEPNQTLRLTLRYKRYDPPPTAGPEPRFVLEGVTFDSGKATIRPESFPQLDGVVEYMTYKTSSRIQISGHTDSQGNPKQNKALSQKRAEACRDYLVQKGIDKNRIEAMGYGDERPLATNDTEDGRRTNRRIEATEL
jgi:outer membrane protein OmpA-like peptidoglycan-associated protein